MFTLHVNCPRLSITSHKNVNIIICEKLTGMKNYIYTVVRNFLLLSVPVRDTCWRPICGLHDVPTCAFFTLTIKQCAVSDKDDKNVNPSCFKC